MNKLALGTVQFGLDYGVANTTGRVIPQVAGEIMSYAKEAGMDTLDTAIAYGNSESVLGDLGVTQWKVVTKLPAVPDDCHDVREWVEKQVHESIERLRVERLYGLMLHTPAQLFDQSGPYLYSALQDLRADGVVKKIGVSVYGTSELELLCEKFQFDLVQAPLNILDRNLSTSGWANRLQQAGIEVHTRSAFLQGLLLMPDDVRPSKFQAWGPIWLEWKRWQEETGLTPLQACLRYVCSLDGIDRAIVGVNDVDQLRQIVNAAQDRLPSLPNFATLQDERLINPASWSQL